MFKKSKYVYEIYREGSFTKAAKKLGVSQPCLSAVVKNIESGLGAPIFERTTGPLIPTQVGLEYIKTAEKIVLLQEEFNSKIGDIAAGDMGDVRIGTQSHILMYILPVVLDEFRRRYPKINLSFVEGNSRGLREMLMAGELNLVIDSFTSEPAGCVLKPLREEKVLLAVPSAYEENERYDKYSVTPELIYETKRHCDALPSVPLSTFMSKPFVLLKDGCVISEHSEAAIERGGLSPNVIMRLDSPSTAYAFTADGHACSFVTDTFFRYRAARDAVKLYNFSGGGSDRNIGCRI